MSQELLQKIVHCPSLPSLPGVALEVLDLTRDPNVPIAVLARTVENDQALSAKILKTINSSFYGLTRPCPTIARAVGYLGLNTVKSLVLSFSVLDTFRGEDEPVGVGMMWQRAVYSASGARSIAQRAGEGVDPDEAFIGGLLQDIGMLAMMSALGEDYLGHIVTAGELHDELPAIEREAYELDHAQVGRALAEAWRLPEELADVVARHHAPYAEDEPLLLSVARLASTASAALCVRSDTSAPARFRREARKVLGLDDEAIAELLAEVSERSAELSRLFRTDAGQKVDARALMSQASEQLIAHQITMERERADMAAANQDLAEKVITDGLTKAFNRAHFDATLESALASAREGGSAVAVILGDGDHFKSINDEHGHAAGDAVLVELAGRMREAVGDDGMVFRYGGEEFAAVLPGAARAVGGRIAERVRKVVEATPFSLEGVECEAETLDVTMSLGVAAFEPDNPTALAEPAQLLAASDRAVYAAKHAGRNCVRVFAPRVGEQPASGSSRESAPSAARVQRERAPIASGGGAAPGTFVLVLEDDPLHASIIQHHLGTIAGVTTRHVESAEDAIWCLRSGGRRPDILVADLHLPGMDGTTLVQAVREACGGGSAIPVIVISSSDDPDAVERALAAGASSFVSKAAFADNPSALIDQVTSVRRSLAA